MIPGNPKERRILVAPDVENELRWGKLVKSWITGRNYVEKSPYPRPPVDKPPAYPRPNSFRELVEQCEDPKVKVNLIYDDGASTQVDKGDPISLVMVHGNNTDALVIRLSASDFVEKSEDDIVKTPDTYKIAAFYGDVLKDTTPKPEKVDSEEKRLNIHAQRVGEYTIAMCF